MGHSFEICKLNGCESNRQARKEMLGITLHSFIQSSIQGLGLSFSFLLDPLRQPPPQLPP